MGNINMPSVIKKRLFVAECFCGKKLFIPTACSVAVISDRGQIYLKKYPGLNLLARHKDLQTGVSYKKAEILCLDDKTVSYQSTKVYKVCSPNCQSFQKMVKPDMSTIESEHVKLEEDLTAISPICVLNKGNAGCISCQDIMIEYMHLCLSGDINTTGTIYKIYPDGKNCAPSELEWQNLFISKIDEKYMPKNRSTLLCNHCQQA